VIYRIHESGPTTSPSIVTSVVDTITSVSAPIGTEIAEAVASINTNPILASMGGLQTVALATVGLFGLHKIFAYLKDQEALTPRFFSDNDLDGVMAKLNEIATNISISIDDIPQMRVSMSRDALLRAIQHVQSLPDMDKFPHIRDTLVMMRDMVTDPTPEVINQLFPFDDDPFVF